MGTTYAQLSIEDRCRIAGLQEQGRSIRQIGLNGSEESMSEAGWDALLPKLFESAGIDAAGGFTVAPLTGGVAHGCCHGFWNSPWGRSIRSMVSDNGESPAGS